MLEEENFSCAQKRGHKFMLDFERRSINGKRKHDLLGLFENKNSNGENSVLETYTPLKIPVNQILHQIKNERWLQRPAPPQDNPRRDPRKDQTKTVLSIEILDTPPKVVEH